MARKNQFYGIVISGNVISEYYPNNFNFSHFVFQQKIQDGEEKNQDYLLNVYAIGINGMVMNYGAMLNVQDPQNGSYPAGTLIEFANAKLNLNMLMQLYPPGSIISDLSVQPSEYYEKTGYIVYTAKTIPIAVDASPIVVKLNPSPPA